MILKKIHLMKLRLKFRLVTIRNRRQARPFVVGAPVSAQDPARRPKNVPVRMTPVRDETATG